MLTNIKFKLRKLLMFLLLACFVVSANGVMAQNKKDLEKSKKNIESKITYTKKLLNETASQKKSSLNELSLLSKQIKNRQELIGVYNSEINYVNNEIANLEKQIVELQAELKRLKENYSKLVYQSYKSHSQVDQWMYIFSSDDFYQAYNRVKYIKAISTIRKEAVEDILAKEAELQTRINQFRQVKNEKVNLLNAKEQEAKSLLNDKSKKEVAVKSIVQKEQELKRQLNEQQQEWKQLNEKIKKIIEEQMKPATSNSGTSTSKLIPLTPEEKLLAESFADNKGKLPWPSERGQITSAFGPHPHPHLHVTIDNKGVDIRTEKGATARSVFDGKVNRIFQLGKFKAVLIQHGSYFTVYSNLSEVFVAEGQKVTTKQSIGIVGTSSDSGETVLHFELWNSKANAPQNPQMWILR